MLHLHRSERADALVGGLAEVLRRPPPDPFAVDVVAVPTKGVERWLAQRLSHALGASDGPGAGDGICAGVVFPSPARLIDDTVAVAASIAPDGDPWAAGRLVWTLLGVIDECVYERWCSPLAAYLGGAGGDDRGRRLTAATHLVRLFDSYGAHRPDMLRGWAVGESSDGAGGPLDADLGWQAELWRRLRARVGVESPAERIAAACATLRDRPGVADLPERVSLFGPTRLTAAALEVLAALADRRDVHVFLPHPSPALWQRVEPYAAAARRSRRRDDPTATVPRNPLLASLGRDARELQVRLATLDAPTDDRHYPVDDRPHTLLGLLQQAIRNDSEAAATPRADRPLLRPDDRSLAVHACHGPARQVEVLRDVIVGLLAADPTLEPRDVLVMCPDIEDYAPLISATFGIDDVSHDESDDGPGDTGGAAGQRHPGHRLRVRLADRSLRQTNPLLGTLGALLGLADARVTASEVMDIAALPPVRRRFRFSDDDLDRLAEWVAAAGVRWGLDAEQRARYGLGRVPQNTWRAGLDRVLLGAAMADDRERWVGLALPLDDVDSSDVDLAGRLAELVDRLAAVIAATTGRRPLEEWLATLGYALDALTAVGDADAWQSAQARRELAQVGADAGERAAYVELSLADVRALFADRLRGRPTRANFRTGSLTMCSMVPMRSVPHRVVCLLGLDDGSFPRSAGIDGDDVLARDPCIGERDPRSEDRQLLLDAVLAAREHLVVLYTGADPRTNAPRPPAVPVGEILDAVDAAVRTADGVPPRAHVVVHHPLQPFDARNFTAGALGVPGPFSFDRQALRGAERAAEPRHAPPPFLAGPLPPADRGDLTLDELVAFLEQPAAGFLRQRLAVAIPREEEQLADGLTVELGSLQKWAVGDRLLAARLAGVDTMTCVQAEWRRGTLPPRELGRRVLDAMVDQVEPLVAASAPYRDGEPRAVDVLVDLAGRRLSGTVGNVYGDAVVRVTYSRLAAKHRLRAWAGLLTLSAAHPGTQWTAVTLGRSPGRTLRPLTLGPVDPEEAARLLAELIDLRDRGLAEPLPMAVKTSAAYAGRRREGGTPDEARAAAEREWTNNTFGGESAEAAHEMVWGTGSPLDALLAEPPRADETGAGWYADEPTRFGALACRLWTPLLAAEHWAQP